MNVSENAQLEEIRGIVIATQTEVGAIKQTQDAHTGEIQAISKDIATLRERSRGVRRELDQAQRRGGLFGLGGGAVVLGLAKLVERLTGGGGP